MDIQKERELFLAHMRSIGSARFMFELDEDGNFDDMSMSYAWSAWRAAKSQAVPDGFVLVPVETLDEALSWANCAASETWTDEQREEIDKHYEVIEKAMLEAQEPK